VTYAATVTFGVPGNARPQSDSACAEFGKRDAHRIFPLQSSPQSVRLEPSRSPVQVDVNSVGSANLSHRRWDRSTNLRFPHSQARRQRYDGANAVLLPEWLCLRQTLLLIPSVIFPGVRSARPAPKYSLSSATTTECELYGGKEKRYPHWLRCRPPAHRQLSPWRCPGEWEPLFFKSEYGFHKLFLRSGALLLHWTSRPGRHVGSAS